MSAVSQRLQHLAESGISLTAIRMASVGPVGGSSLRSHGCGRVWLSLPVPVWPDRWFWSLWGELCNSL